MHEAGIIDRVDISHQTDKRYNPIIFHFIRNQLLPGNEKQDSENLLRDYRYLIVMALIAVTGLGAANDLLEGDDRTMAILLLRQR